MIDFFPELAGKLSDPRKREITIRELLQMRAGYPWEGRRPPYFERLFMRNDWRWLPHIEDFALVADPGLSFGYSNLSSHLLAVIVQRACGRDLRSLSQQKLFDPLGARVPRWTSDPDGYNFGWGEIYLRARDMAKFGLLYLGGGRFGGEQVIPAAWVGASLQPYSLGINIDGVTGSAAGLYFRDIGYGYQWWSARAGEHRFDFAWGHGGQLVVLLPEQDMVIVTTADPLHHLPEESGWPHEVKILDLVGRFINGLPDAKPLAQR
jgi:CubicO group peptidase (beta-lactamase class C family)